MKPILLNVVSAFLLAPPAMLRMPPPPACTRHRSPPLLSTLAARDSRAKPARLALRSPLTEVSLVPDKSQREFGATDFLRRNCIQQALSRVPLRKALNASALIAN